MGLPDAEVLSAARPIRVQTATHAAAPVDGTTDPDIVTSALTPAGQPTSGVAVMLKAPTFGAAPTLAGTTISVTVWIRNPITKQWGSSTSFTPAYGEWFGTGDFPGGELYFQMDAASFTVNGGVDFNVLEI